MRKNLEREGLTVRPEDAPAEFTVRIGRQVGAPTDRQTALRAFAYASSVGYPDVGFLRRDGPAALWEEQPAPAVLVPITARPFSVVRGRH